MDCLAQNAKSLAIGWWKFARQRGDYSQCANPDCRIIFAKMESTSDDFFDFEAFEVREHFRAYCNEIEKRDLAGEAEISNIYDAFLSTIEEGMGKEFKVIHYKVQAPKKYKTELPFDLATHPSCFVVKDPRCITIEKIEEPQTED